jgi:hypothetical protein
VWPAQAVRSSCLVAMTSGRVSAQPRATHHGCGGHGEVAVHRDRDDSDRRDIECLCAPVRVEKLADLRAGLLTPEGDRAVPGPPRTESRRSGATEPSRSPAYRHRAAVVGQPASYAGACVAGEGRRVASAAAGCPARSGGGRPGGLDVPMLDVPPVPRMPWLSRPDAHLGATTTA